jgi:putative Mg2+ transporter-C (MgtC) family protein
MEFLDFAIRIACATAAGAFIGLEREWKNKEAGLKTNMLVALGAAVFVLISLTFRDDKYTDITRVLSQVIIGIGFIGGGAILKKDNSNIQGITTAATIWCSAAAGCLAAVGMYLELALLTAVVVIINYIFGKIDTRINKEKDQ